MKEGGAYADVAAEDNDSAGVICSGCIWCWSGDDSGDPLDRDDRSEPEETDCFCMESVSTDNALKLWPEGGKHTSSNVRRLGQNSKSSSRSKERPASKRCRYADIVGNSTATGSFTCLFARYWR